MRRVVVEVYGPELLRRIARSPGFGRLQAFEVLHLLRYDREEFAAVCRVTPKDPMMSAEACFRGDPVTRELQVLQRDADSAIVLLKRRPRGGPPGRRAVLGRDVTTPGSGYLLGPLSFKDDTLRFTFVGNRAQVNDVLGRAGVGGLQYRIISLHEAEFPGSLLDRLTERQRTVLVAAFRQGYYELPRSATSQQIGETLQLTAATVAEHLRKAERRLLVGLIQETEAPRRRPTRAPRGSRAVVRPARRSAKVSK
ncbi:MAG: helix-turn-helix domain-containing protein [Thermoplasmata archaeon]|nr:helix-turn-helix domain-containing protein [Thermoplasmata archaeon]